MRTLFTLLVLAITLPFTVLAQQAHIPGEVMLMLRPKEDVGKLIRNLNDGHPGANFQIAREVTAEWNIWLLRYDNQFISDKSALLYVSQHPAVALSQFNYPVELRIAPNDPSYAGQQWALNNTGQTGGTPDADVDAPEAWDITTGGTTVDGDEIVVAVIDGGFQNNHPDLTANYWVNTAETAGNGIDDDGNGYIDDVNGWDAYSNDGTIPSDNHGTHVSGIIGARGNNSTGVSGVNWNVKVMRIAGSSGNTATVVSAYAYAAKQRKIYNQTNGASGAFVVSTNSSFGVDFGQPANFPIWCAFYDTLGTLGILSAGAGPNSNTNIDTQGDIPTACPSSFLVAVTNTTNTDARNSSCGYGPINMDIGAPGTNIYSTVTGSNYQNLTGTSMATPHVAGAIGLYYSAACADFITAYKADPGAMALLMRGFLLTGVDSISSMSATTSSKGRLNLLKGIQNVQAGCAQVPPPAPVASFLVSDSEICAGEQVTFTDASSEMPTAWAWSFPGATPSSSASQNPTVTYNTAGTFNVTLTVTNAGGSDTEVLSAAVKVNAIPAAPVVTEDLGTLMSSYATGNQWYQSGGTPVNGATNQSLVPPSNGFYYVIHTSDAGCVSAASNSVLIAASVNDAVLGGLSIYPNPMMDQVTLSWTDAQATVTEVRLYDAVGRLVREMAPSAGGSSVTLSVTDLPAGGYILEGITSKGTFRKTVLK